MPVWDDQAFMKRREKAREKIFDELGLGMDPGGRKDWFKTVYEIADGDPAAVPWADLEPKPLMVEYLKTLIDNQKSGKKAIDVACGLGDNAEALATAGFDVTAFDFSEDAVKWAKQRFSKSPVNYQVADLFNYSDEWFQAFDLVHECYTVQALPAEMRNKAIEQIANLVASNGRLLVITRARDVHEEIEGPPWPMTEDELSIYCNFGLTKISNEDVIEKRDRPIRHFRAIFERP